MFLLKLPFFVLCLPFVYIILNIDLKYGSISGFVACLFGAICIGFYGQYTSQLRSLFLANGVSFFLSVYLASTHSNWQFIYQPFDPNKVVLILSFAYLIPQVIGIFWATFFKKSCK